MSDIPDERTKESEARVREVRLQEIINGLVREGGRSQTPTSCRPMPAR